MACSKGKYEEIEIGIFHCYAYTHQAHQKQFVSQSSLVTYLKVIAVGQWVLVEICKALRARKLSLLSCCL